MHLAHPPLVLSPAKIRPVGTLVRVERGKRRCRTSRANIVQEGETAPCGVWRNVDFDGPTDPITGRRESKEGLSVRIKLMVVVYLAALLGIYGVRAGEESLVGM